MAGAGPGGNLIRRPRVACANVTEAGLMRGILLWLLGIPIPIIILLWIFGVLH